MGVENEKLDRSTANREPSRPPVRPLAGTVRTDTFTNATAEWHTPVPYADSLP